MKRRRENPGNGPVLDLVIDAYVPVESDALLLRTGE